MSLAKRARCVRKASPGASENSTDHCIPKRSSLSPTVTYARPPSSATSQHTRSSKLGVCEMGKDTSMPPPIKALRGRLRTGRTAVGEDVHLAPVGRLRKQGSRLAAEVGANFDT